MCSLHKRLSTPVAQSDERPTGDQEIAGSIPDGSGNILSWRLTMKYFRPSFSLFRCFKKCSCQFLSKICAQVLVNHVEDYACPGKIVVK